MNRRAFVSGMASLIGISAAEKQKMPLVRERERNPDADVVRAKWIARHGRSDAPMIMGGKLYDRMRVEAGQTALAGSAWRFFSVPVGISKGTDFTNVFATGMLSAPQEAYVESIGFTVRPSIDDADLDALQRSCSWEFLVLDRVYARAPLLLNGPMIAELGEEANELNHQFEDAGVQIGSLVQFSVRMFFAETVKFRGEVDMLCSLNGLLAQGIC